MKKLSLISIMAVGVTAVAHASGPLGDASSFNAFIFGSYSLASDSDGPIASGGAMTGSQNIDMHGFAGTLGNTIGVDIYGGKGSSVGGNLDGNGGSVYLQSGSFSANNNAKASVNIGTNTALATRFAGDEAFLKDVSNNLAGYTVASGMGYDFDVNYTNNGGNDALFQYGGKSVDLGTHNNLSFSFGNGLNNTIASNFTIAGVNMYVLDVTAAELNTLNSESGNIAFNGLDATHNLIINVIGTGANSSVTWDPQQQVNGGNAYTLYNFVNVGTVNTDQLFTGSIMAVNSNLVQGNGDIQGNVIANSFVQDAEIHFGGDGNGDYMGYVPTPEPAPFAALGLGALLFIRRRRK